MHAGMIQVTTKPGHIKDCIKAMVEAGTSTSQATARICRCSGSNFGYGA